MKQQHTLFPGNGLRRTSGCQAAIMGGFEPVTPKLHDLIRLTAVGYELQPSLALPRVYYIFI